MKMKTPKKGIFITSVFNIIIIIYEATLNNINKKRNV